MTVGVVKEKYLEDGLLWMSLELPCLPLQSATKPLHSFTLINITVESSITITITMLNGVCFHKYSSQMDANEARILLGFPPNSRPTTSQVFFFFSWPLFSIFFSFIQLRLPKSEFASFINSSSVFEPDPILIISS